MSISTPLSDLFFNQQHNWTGSPRNSEVIEEAEVFCSLIQDAFNVVIDPLDVAEDFLGRL